jgi:hypothetical protein
MKKILLKNFWIFLIVVLLFIYLQPLIVIWSLNTLFPSLHIPYTVETWMATLILVFALGAATFKR